MAAGFEHRFVCFVPEQSQPAVVKYIIQPPRSTTESVYSERQSCATRCCFGAELSFYLLQSKGGSYQLS